MNKRKACKERKYRSQQFEDTKGVTRSLKARNDRQCHDIKFEDTKGVTRSLKARNDSHHNDQKKNDSHHNDQKKDKMTNNNLQNTTQKTKDRATQAPLRTRDEKVVWLSLFDWLVS